MPALTIDSPDERQRRRQTGILLLALASAFVLVNTLSLGAQAAGSGIEWLLAGAWFAAAWGGWWYLNARLPDHDPYLFPLVMLLSGWGLLMIDRLAPNFSNRQMLWLLLSVAVMCVTASQPRLLRWLRQYRYLLLIFGMGLLVSTVLLGTNPSGVAGAPELWLGVGTVFFQPSELLKVILVAFLASYLSDQVVTLRMGGARWWQKAWLSPRFVGPMLLMWALCIVVLIWQRDLGTALLFFLIFITLLYVASAQWWILAVGLLLAGLAGVVAYASFAVVRLRVDIWLNPWPDADGRAFQIVQSLMAVSSGGIFGRGIGQGSPGFIPVVHSDFIFAALAEEWGLIGVVTVLGVLAVLFMRGMTVAVRQKQNPFNALLAAGLTLSLALQTLMILAGVLKLFPLTGVTLPFVSYGGSSMLMSFVMVGLLLRLSCERD